MEDLYDVQVHKMDAILESQKLVQADDLISTAVFETSSIAGQIMQAFHEQRVTEVPVNAERLQALLMRAVEWTTVLFYCFEIDPPEIEDLPEYADCFETVIAVDPILSSLYIHRSLSDVCVDYFTREEAMDNEETETALIDILSCLELIARRVGTSVTSLITGV